MKYWMGLAKKVDKPRRKSYHYGIKTKGVQNDTNDNKNTKGTTPEVKRTDKE